jgi:predicted RNase H-like nuclease (RuvC/YqgF family)
VINWGLIVQIILPILTGLIGYLAYRLTAKALHQQAITAAKAVDAEAYSRAQAIYDSAIEQLRREIAEVRGERDRLRRINDHLEETNDRLSADVEALREFRVEAQRLKTANDSLRREVDSLTAELTRMRQITTRLEGNSPGGTF